VPRRRRFDGQRKPAAKQGAGVVRQRDAHESDARRFSDCSIKLGFGALVWHSTNRCRAQAFSRRFFCEVR
jgi:hypothetical protein